MIMIGDIRKLAINAERLLATINETSRWGAHSSLNGNVPRTGMCRLALSKDDKKVRDWFVQEAKTLGCRVSTDEIGNIFAVYPGKKEGLPVAIGSHLDTQPTGGRYDGVYGVLAGLEVLRTLKDNNHVPNYPIAVVDWTNEEGARFPKSLMGSGVWARTSTLESTYSLVSITDDTKRTVLQCLEDIGYKGNTPADYRLNPLKAHFELHIEQGPILEKKKKSIGVVTSVQAYSWIEVIFKGRAQHTGTTPMDMRFDSFLFASKICLSVNEAAKKYDGLGSVAELELHPNVVNVIADYTRITIDIRHGTDSGLDAMENEIENTLRALADSGAIDVTFKRTFHSPAVNFDESCVKAVTAAAERVVGSDQYMQIRSGAGHDSCSTTHANVPTAMIFIPSKDGISHNPKEYSSPEEIATGFEVLLDAVLQYDAARND